MPSMFKHHFDAEPFAEKYPRLVAELEECLAESAKHAEKVMANLGGLGYGE